MFLFINEVTARRVGKYQNSLNMQRGKCAASFPRGKMSLAAAHYLANIDRCLTMKVEVDINHPKDVNSPFLFKVTISIILINI